MIYLRLCLFKIDSKEGSLTSCARLFHTDGPWDRKAFCPFLVFILRTNKSILAFVKFWKRRRHSVNLPPIRAWAKIVQNHRKAFYLFVFESRISQGFHVDRDVFEKASHLEAELHMYGSKRVHFQKRPDTCGSSLNLPWNCFSSLIISKWQHLQLFWRNSWKIWQN